MEAPGLHTPFNAPITIVSEMNDRSATTMSTGPPVTRGRDVADVRALDVRDPVVGAQPLVQLSVADVDGDDVTGAALQEAVGEAAGRCPGVERQPPGDVDAERGQRVLELLTAATHVPRRWSLDDDRFGGGDQPRRP